MTAMRPADPVAALRDALEAHGCGPRGSEDRFMARCPAHDDRNPSLSITAAEDGRALVHCFAGCLTEDVVAKVGMCLADLFPDRIAPYDLSPRDLRTTLETIGPASLAVKSARSNGHGPGRRLLMTKVSDVKAEAVRWLWQGRVVLGMLNVVVGEPGLGKSTLAYDLAAKLSRGALEGDLYGEPSDALVVTYEDHVASVVRPRLEAAGADVTRVRVIGVRQEDDSEGLLSLPADLDLIRDAIERTGARLLIVDPIVASLAGEISSHRDQDVRRVLAPLAQMAERHDIAVAAIMHVNKSTAKQFFQRVGGSIGFTGAARSMLLVARDPDDPDGERGRRRIVAHGKCNVGPLAPSLLFELESLWLPGDIETSKLYPLGECETSTADLLGADSADDRLEVDEAVEFLQAELANGKRPAEEITSAAATRGIAERTLKRARKAAGVKATRTGFGRDGRWFLELTDDVSHRGPSPNGTNPVASYGKTPDLQGEPPLDLVSNLHRGPTFDLGPLWSETPECECSVPDRHTESWRPHPATGRLVCHVCHPPALERTE